jgi:hypothetical protein
MTTVTPLAAFSDDWVGGDIRGLQGIAAALYAYVPQVQDLAGRLSVVAGALTSADGWQGAAASAFATAWEKQALTAVALETYVTAAGEAIDGLAGQLSKLENALEQAAAEAAANGVRIAADGTVAGYTGAQAGQWAFTYQETREQILSEATTARQAATQSLYSYYEQVTNVDLHPNVTDGVTLFDLLGDLLAAPTAARREVNAKLDKAKGEELKIKEEFDEQKSSGEVSEKTADESAKAEKELEEVEEELGKTGKLESTLSKLLDTRVSNVQDFLNGKAGEGKHVGGNTPDDLKAAAGEDEPGEVEKLLKLGGDIPVVDIAAALLGTGVGTYYDVKGGQSPGSALLDEAGSNGAGIVAGALSGSAASGAVSSAATALTADGAGAVGSTIGEELGSVGGPVGIAVGAVVGYAVGDFTHNLTVEQWGQDREKYGAVLGTLYGVGHSEAATVDDARETAVGVGHDVEHLWDSL